MVDITPQPDMTPEQAYQRLQEWYQKKAQLNALKSHEHLERVALSEFYFSKPREGTNRLDIGGGYDLKLQFSYNYKVSEEDLDQVKAADIKRLKLPWDELFVYKPELVKKVYNNLTAEQKKFVDAILDIKPASPQLDIVPAANREGQQAHAEAARGEVHAGSAIPSHELNNSQFEIVLDAEEAKPGNYYHDGETWWQLGEDFEWSEIEDADLIELLDQQAEDNKPVPAAPKRRGRKKAGA